MLALLAGALVGCGGSDVTLAQYAPSVLAPGTQSTMTDMVSTVGGLFIIGQADGQAFYQLGTGSPVLYPNQLSGSQDLIAGINESGTVVGFDSSTTAGQNGLLGNTAAWAPSNFGATITTEYIRPSAIASNGTIAFLVLPQTGTGVAYRRVGATNTALTGFTDFKPTVINGVNSAGKIVGNGTVLTDNVAWMSDNNTIINIGVGVANAVNSDGIVVGMNESNRPYRTVGANSTNRAALALLPGFTRGEATDINDEGIIVGWQQETTVSPKIPVAWYSNGALVDLRSRITSPPSNVDLQEAVAISESGSILVQGKRTTGGLEAVGVLLTVL